jgi:hypothetical protein
MEYYRSLSCSYAVSKNIEDYTLTVKKKRWKNSSNECIVMKIVLSTPQSIYRVNLNK